MGSISARTPPHRPATLEDFLAIPASRRHHEILEGELVEKTMPSARHGAAQLCLGSLLAPFGHSALPGQPGGWWLLSEVEVLLLGRHPLRPDLAGWRIENMLELPDEFPVKARPDWVCEIVSPNDARRDTIVKYRDYARAGIPHYWMVDLGERTLTTLILQNEHYAIDVEADANQSVRTKPFELVEIAVELLFGQRRQ